MLDLSKIMITPEILSLISEIDEFKGAWQLHGRMASERLKTLGVAAKIESVGASMRLDGAKLADTDVMRLLFNAELHSLTIKDQRDGFSYARAYDGILQKHHALSFSENCLKQIYDWLMYSDTEQESLKKEKNVSNHDEVFDAPWKDLNITFAKTKLFETTTPFEMPEKLKELFLWTQMQLDQKTLHPLLIIGIFTALFLNMRPFQELDGCLSRVLTLFLLLKAGYIYAPYSSIERIIERNKEYYQLALERTQETLHADAPDFDIWLTFFLKVMQSQKRNLEHKILKDKNPQEHLSELDNQIINAISEHEKLSIMKIEQITGANRNTLKKHLAFLVEQSYIVRFGKARATWYVLS
ncbi:MAG: Fic family protein [Pseudomonadota bacterium]